MERTSDGRKDRYNSRENKKQGGKANLPKQKRSYIMKENDYFRKFHNPGS